MRDSFWTLPENYQELVDALRWAAGENFTFEVEAPLTVVAEFQKHREKEKYLVHLLNYQVTREQESVVEDIQISMKVPQQLSFTNIHQVSADEGEVQKLSYENAGDRLLVQVPQLHTYSLVVFE
jgi:hypothetical protein